MTAAPDAGLALEVSGLTKTYATGLFHKRRYEALRGVSFSVPRGEIFGYLGPNGSGKTTTLKVLMGLIFADSGMVSVLGRRLEDRAWRHEVGYLPEHPYFYDYLTPSEYLDYAGRLFGMAPGLIADRSRELLDLVGLGRSADVPLRRFSKGMVQRLGLAQAMLNDGALLFLDEPMSGLDPIGRRLVRDVILSLKERGKTVVFSTHILSDAETLCDRIALLRSGELLRVGRLDEILRLDVAHLEVLVAGLDAAALAGLPLAAARRRAVGERARLRPRLHVAEGGLGPVVSAVEAAGGRVLSVHPVRQSLEEYFFREMGGAEALARSLEAE
jgi:ABC-2 type transport system ATP-binding protein